MATRTRKPVASPLPTVAPVDPVNVIVATLGERIDGIFAALERANQEAQSNLAVEVNTAVDGLAKLGKVAGEITDLVGKVFEEHRPKSARQYIAGLKFALAWGLKWNAAMHSLLGQAQALDAAGKIDKSPKHKTALVEHLAAKEDAAEEKAAKKTGAKSKAGKKASREAILEALKALVADAHLIGAVDLVADITDTIHAYEPAWKDPANKPDAK